MSWASAIPMGIGVISSLFGKGKGKETEYTAQAPEYQQQFSEDFMKFLSSQMGQGATPYGGQIAASAQNPFTQSALGLWGASPYGQMGGQQQPQMPQQPMGQLGDAPGPMGQRPMPPMPMRASGMMGAAPTDLKRSRMPQQGLGGRGVPFRR